jgi:hypothetical protein
MQGTSHIHASMTWPTQRIQLCREIIVTMSLALTCSLNSYSRARSGGGAPIELVTEFLACVMGKRYAAAAPLCDEILRLEPGNDTARQFRPLIAEARTALSPELVQGDARCACLAWVLSCHAVVVQKGVM